MLLDSRATAKETVLGLFSFHEKKKKKHKEFLFSSFAFASVWWLSFESKASKDGWLLAASL